LQCKVAGAGLQVRVVLDEREEVTQLFDENVLVPGLGGGGPGACQGRVPGLYHTLKQRLLICSIPFHGFDQIGDEIVAPLEFGINA
jgi:hypothetical protein